LSIRDMDRVAKALILRNPPWGNFLQGFGVSWLGAMTFTPPYSFQRLFQPQRPQQNQN